MNARAYYNENDPFAAQWLRNLIAAGLVPAGDVDERDIRDVRPGDLAGYTQAHFFAGIGGWGYALRLAGWPDDRPVWTGSCPCQPFSDAARGRNGRLEDPRHLWPTWRGLIAANRPRAVFGEQVAAAGDWLDGVGDDLEAMGYAFGAAILPACGVGLDHARPRIFFMGHADSEGEPGSSFDAQVGWLYRDRSDAGDMVRTNGVPARMAKLRALGNAIVPQVAAEFIRAACGIVGGG